MTLRLTELVAEARALANDHPCDTSGHTWESEGGRSCPKGHYNCSQPVFRCTRCGEYDYGDKGGPGHKNCFVVCSRETFVLEEE